MEIAVVKKLQIIDFKNYIQSKLVKEVNERVFIEVQGTIIEDFCLLDSLQKDLNQSKISDRFI